MTHLSKRNLTLVIAGLLLSILMASMDNTIVATAMGNIVGELGGMDKFVWVTSAYMVAEMAGMPIFGKLSDMYGRKRFFVFGIIVFMIGSALCGTAGTITELAIYRAIQGIGGGALIPIAFTILLDAVPLEKRGSLTGLFGAVFGLSSVFGPLLGAYITDHISWQWIFYINLPLGAIAFALVAFNYKESHEHSKQPIDWLGASTLLGAIVCLIFALELGGKTFAWSSFEMIGLIVGFVVLAIGFVIAERKAEEPIISFKLFKNRLYTSSILVALFSGAAFIVASVYIPIFIQGVLGGTATNSGLVLLPMMIGTVITATLGGMVISKLSYRSVIIPTLALLGLGTALVTTLTPESSRLLVTSYMVLIGLGIGASFSVLSSAAIHGLSYRQRGSASATLNFLRSLGMTLGITVFGLIQSQSFSNKMSGLTADGAEGGAALPEGLNLEDTHTLLMPETRQLIPNEFLDAITGKLSDSIVQTFAWAVIPVALALLAASFMGRDKLDASTEAVESTDAVKYSGAH
ncbi:MDR family MFS transporter [Paenibacillus harenae]|uniref:MDR family MFS transporter n=1 Tax=Paenibacillus harenae TaxID=306543 RepID=UPI0027902451|nr:MDR family MFS transporter [Paenibacillus harenae]MDQ0057909.1 EmrB/QacA subfamily drug resistance transporter [Paenibacillus harenae]